MNRGKKLEMGRYKIYKLFFVIMFACLLSLANQASCFATTVTLKWDLSTDPNLSGYKVYYQANSSTQPFQGTDAAQGASPIILGNLTSATISGLNSSNAYSFAITAYDTSGLESAYSNIVTVPEQVSPTVSITSPANNALASGTVSVNASASDNVGVTKVEFYVNGALQSTDTSTPYLYSWNTSALAASSYTVMAKAYDAAGNVGQSANITVTVAKDTIPPTISITSPANNATVNGTTTIRANATDNIGVTNVQFYLDGTLITATNVTPYSFNWNTATVSNGAHSFSAKAYDAAGNIGQSSAVSVTVNNSVSDTKAPTVTAFTIPATTTSLTVPVTTFTATDNTGVTGYLITESSTLPLPTASGWTSSAPATYTAPTAGSHTLHPWAKDAAGNVSTVYGSPKTVVISLSDTTRPVVSGFAVPATATSLSVSVTKFTATDNIGVTGYLITESSTPPLPTAAGWTSSAPANYTVTTAGSHTLYPWAKDAAGNVSPVATSLSAKVVANIATAPGTMISPVNASVLKGTSQTFTWSAGANLYVVWVGTSAGTFDIGSFPASGTTATTITATGLPAKGGNIYVRLWSRIGSSWFFNDYSYTSGP